MAVSTVRPITRLLLIADSRHTPSHLSQKNNEAYCIWTMDTMMQPQATQERSINEMAVGVAVTPNFTVKFAGCGVAGGVSIKHASLLQPSDGEMHTSQ